MAPKRTVPKPTITNVASRHKYLPHVSYNCDNALHCGSTAKRESLPRLPLKAGSCPLLRKTAERLLHGDIRSLGLHLLEMMDHISGDPLHWRTQPPGPHFAAYCWLSTKPRKRLQSRFYNGLGAAMPQPQTLAMVTNNVMTTPFSRLGAMCGVHHRPPNCAE